MNLYEQWETHLKNSGVKIPGDVSWGRKSLEYLFKNLNRWVSKEDIIKGIKYNGYDLQAPRHLSSSGWYIEQDYRGNYKLITVKKPFPAWIPDKRTTDITSISWKELKQRYNNECATCGSKEGSPHRHTNKKTKLEKGHKDPTLNLTIKNTIPQCNYCNKRFKDIYKFDNYGLPILIKIKNVWYNIPNYDRTK